MFHQNIAGAISKTEELTFAIRELSQTVPRIDVVCLTETFIKKGSEMLLKVPGFKLVASYSRDTKRGGVCIMINSNIKCKLLTNIDDLMT